MLSFSSVAFAQIPKGNVFLGYSYISADIPNFAHREHLNGWEASFERKVFPRLWLIMAGNYGKMRLASPTSR
jgi:hypothetical protein